VTAVERLNASRRTGPERGCQDLRILCEAPLALPPLFGYAQYVDLSRKMAGLACAKALSAIAVLSRKFNIAIIVVVILGVIVAGPA